MKHAKKGNGCACCDGWEKETREMRLKLESQDRWISEFVQTNWAARMQGLENDLGDMTHDLHDRNAWESYAKQLEKTLREIAAYKHDFGELTAPTAMALSIDQALTVLRQRARQALPREPEGEGEN